MKCHVNVRGEKVRCSTVENYRVMDRNKAGFFEETRVPAKNLPALSSLKLVENKFNEFGSVTDRRKGTKLAITSTEIKKVERLYRNRQLCP